MSYKATVMLNWQLSDLHGWGIAGYEIFSNWALKGKYQPVMGFAIHDHDIRGIDSFRKKMLSPSFVASNSLNSQIIAATKTDTSKLLKINIPVVHALGNNFTTSDIKLVGSANIGRIVFELDNIKNVRKLSEKYDAFVVASTWNKDILQTLTDKPVFLNHEGVDTTRFHPGPKSELLNVNDFYIFSSGKIEHRKSQDIVLSVFRKFSEGKKRVKLVTAWQSVFATLISQGYKGILANSLEVVNGSANIVKWAVDNGVSADKIIDLGQVPHHMVPHVMREMDAALQLSRAEGGTNFVAMECMASGVPTLLSKCTGHLDIINYPNAIPVEVTPKVLSDIDGATDWREADIDDAVAKLEVLYRQKQTTGTTHGKEGFPRTWTQHSEDLEKIISNYC